LLLPQPANRNTMRARAMKAAGMRFLNLLLADITITSAA